jgi:bifunctional non-homologous end joining protein LigD
MAKRRVSKSKKQYVQSVNTRAMDLVRDLQGAKGAPMPEYIEPLLAKLWDHPPSSDDWVHEIKYDGYRLQLHKNEINVSCYTRRGYDWRDRFPDIAKAAWHLNAHAAILDGEAVVVTEKGDSDFSALESYVSSKQADRDQHHVVFYAFDLLYLDGFDLRDAPLIGRKEALRALLDDLDKGSPIRYSEHLQAAGPSVLKQACDMELEGVVSKRKSAKYHSGRNEAWVKVTCRHRETFVIAGLAFKGRKFDGVYLGGEEKGKLAYAGKVEHGFNEQQVADLKQRAEKLTIKKPGIDLPNARACPKAHWIKPVLLGDVEFRRKTKSGLLRHPSYKGLREDLMELPQTPRRSFPSKRGSNGRAKQRERQNRPAGH